MPDIPLRRTPPLDSTHFLDAVLYANRVDMLRALPIKRGGVVAEIGVAHGEFSEIMLEVLSPAKFCAFDTFDLHTLETAWGIPTAVLLKGMTHRQFYAQRFDGRDAEVSIHEGFSSDTLPNIPDETFDAIYVDARHDYEGVRSDAIIATRKIKRTGVLIFNDYTTFDQFQGVPYGVVPAVNELVTTSDWKIVGFALEPNMFCDIALKRSAR